MIKGKAKMEFGTGDIRMTAVQSYGIGALCCITQEPHEIGERVAVTDTWSAKESEVIMTFTKEESIDALIAELQDVKRLMRGEFPDPNIAKDDTPFDFDAFMEGVKTGDLSLREQAEKLVEGIPEDMRILPIGRR